MKLSKKLRDLALVAHALECAGMAPQMHPRGLLVQSYGLRAREQVIEAVTGSTDAFGIYDAEQTSADPLILRFRRDVAGFDVSVVLDG